MAAPSLCRPSRRLAWIHRATELYWVRYADQFTPRFEFTDTLSPGDVFAAAEAEWHALAAPGHAAGALIFYSPKRRLLITGDALWEHGMGVILPRDGNNPELEAALDTLALIEGLDVDVVIPGHGTPFRDARTAVAEARARLMTFKSPPVKCARHFMKVMFVFALLAQGPLGLGSAGVHRPSAGLRLTSIGDLSASPATNWGQP